MTSSGIRLGAWDYLRELKPLLEKYYKQAVVKWRMEWNRIEWNRTSVVYGIPY